MSALKASPIMSQSSAALDTTSRQETSALVKASPYLMDCLKHGLSAQECERRAQGSERLREVFSSIPWHAQRAAKDPDYWNKLYASSVNW
jgi:hypothetical protein